MFRLYGELFKDLSYSRQKERLRKIFFVKTDAGQTIFYPYASFIGMVPFMGPYQGYVIRKAAHVDLIMKSMDRFGIGVIVSMVVSMIVFYAFGLNFDWLLIVGLLDYIPFHFYTKRITRKLQVLPRSLSIKLYVTRMDHERMSTFMVSSFTGFVIGALVTFLEPQRLLFWFGTLYFALSTIVPAYLLWRSGALVREESRRLQSP